MNEPRMAEQIIGGMLLGIIGPPTRPKRRRRAPRLRVRSVRFLANGASSSLGRDVALFQALQAETGARSSDWQRP
jgi:hypothetical protein